MTKIRINGELRTQEFVLGQIWESVKNIETRMDKIEKNGCAYSDKLEKMILANDKRISNHETGHKVAYGIMSVIAGVIAWFISQFR